MIHKHPTVHLKHFAKPGRCVSTKSFRSSSNSLHILAVFAQHGEETGRQSTDDRMSVRFSRRPPSSLSSPLTAKSAQRKDVHTINGSAVHISSSSGIFCIIRRRNLLLRVFKSHKEDEQCLQYTRNIALHDTIAILGQRRTY